MQNKESINHRKNIHDLIPGGAHTYSKGDDQFPANAPKFISRGKGCYLWDDNNRKYIDLAMSLGTVILGHSYKPVIQKVTEELQKGVNFCRPSLIEGELAEILIDEIPSAEMVKFGKHGSDAVTSAIKLSRAYTGKKFIMRCRQDPFNAIHDWFIGSTIMNRGVPNEVKDLTLQFDYNDLESCYEIFEKHKEQIACVILEPLSLIAPKNCKKYFNNQGSCSCSKKECHSDFLSELKKLCEKNGALLIFDEVVSGFRFDLGGVQKMVGVTPHLSAFGKAMANGFSVSALVGKKEIMKLGGIKHKTEKVFLMSSTHGGETHSIAASIKTIQEIKKHNAIQHFWNIGDYFQKGVNKIIENKNANNFIEVKGYPVKPFLFFKNSNNDFSSIVRTFFMQELINDGILMPYIVPSLSHNKIIIDKVLSSIERVVDELVYLGDEESIKNKIIGSPIKSVFKKFN